MECASLRLFLQRLCFSSPWSYAVFWKLQHQQDMQLTWEDGYYNMPRHVGCMDSITDDTDPKSLDEIFSTRWDQHSVGLAVAEMSSTCYGVGIGVVGEVAQKGMPLWIFSDHAAADRFSCNSVSQCPDEWLSQFAAGIKTILLIPSVPDGVLQLGSFETVAEDAELVAIIKDKYAAHFSKYSLSFQITGEVQYQSDYDVMAKDGEDPVEFDDVMAKEDQMSTANEIMSSCILPVPCYMSTGDMPKVHSCELLCNESMQVMNIFDAGDPYDHQQFGWSETGRSLSLDKIEAISCSRNDNARDYGNHTNDILDFYLDGGLEPPFSNDYDFPVNRSTGNIPSFPRGYELQIALGLDVLDDIQYSSGSSNSGRLATSSSAYAKDLSNSMEIPTCYSDGCLVELDDFEKLLEAAVPAGGISHDNSNLPNNAEKCKSPTRGFSSDSKRWKPSKRSVSVGEDSLPWSSVTTASGARNNLTLCSLSTCSNSAILENQQKGYFLGRKKESKLPSSSSKRRARPNDNKKPRPRDRQLIQDRIKTLRELVPNGSKCSIDGLLDKTIKHMVFLKSVTGRADKLRQQVAKAECEWTRPYGTSWAVELEDEKQTCPIVVKDLQLPGHMLIEMVCNDYERFLEITDVIHRLELTILRGVMEKRSDCTWAHFTVEATGSFHRLDIFWPLMQLAQQN